MLQRRKGRWILVLNERSFRLEHECVGWKCLVLRDEEALNLNTCSELLSLDGGNIFDAADERSKLMHRKMF